MAYPIKGTPFYDDVRETIVASQPWERTNDRDLRLRRPHSSLYYRFALDRVVHEVRGHKLASKPGSLDALRAARHELQAGLARLAMRADPLLRSVEHRALALRDAARPGVR